MNDREDILFTRVIDDRATAQDWAALEDLGASDPGVWRRLAQAQRDQAALCAAVAERVEIAERITPNEAALRGGHEVQIRLRAWSGWAAAAAVALAWAGMSGLLPSNQPMGGETAGFALTSDEALERYLDAGQREGRVLEEMPKLMVETRSLERGAQFEVIYVRQFLERAVVSEVYEMGIDELGNPTPAPAPIQSATWTTADSL
ncbi:MAG: hypothetical protein VYC34_07060 [Planctomycetota bacterium]|nr:hypothetical protein [Planctomycetota bacterium]